VRKPNIKHLPGMWMVLVGAGELHFRHEDRGILCGRKGSWRNTKLDPLAPTYPLCPECDRLYEEEFQRRNGGK
jgi:hypothetical protein